jgi:hypothetical protein
MNWQFTSLDVVALVVAIFMMALGMTLGLSPKYGWGWPFQ